MREVIALVVFISCLPCALAAEKLSQQNFVTKSEDASSVVIRTTRDPVDKSYRKIVSGMRLFDQRKKHLAPNAMLRYKLLPRQADTDMQNIELYIKGDTFSQKVGIEDDRTFTLEYVQKAIDEDASVSPNRRAGSLTWRADIRSPGLAKNHRRLGDLRLECLVGREADLISNRPPIVAQAVSLLSNVIDYCDGIETHYLFFAEQAIFSVTMSFEGRRETLSIDELYAGTSYRGASKFRLSYCDCQVLVDKTYFLPLGDHSWPDDTLIEFEYMSTPSALEQVIPRH